MVRKRELSAMRVGDGRADGQPKAKPVCLRGVERFEQKSRVFVSKARSVIPGRQRSEFLPGNTFGRLAAPKRHPPQRFASGLEPALSQQSPCCGTALDRSFRLRWKAGSAEPQFPRRRRRK